MDDKEFREIVKSLPSYQRLSFIHGERLFIRDADGYRSNYFYYFNNFIFRISKPLKGIGGLKSKMTSYKRPPPRQIYTWSKFHRGVYLQIL